MLESLKNNLPLIGLLDEMDIKNIMYEDKRKFYKYLENNSVFQGNPVLLVLPGLNYYAHA
jgi:hypothetical protein